MTAWVVGRYASDAPVLANGRMSSVSGGLVRQFSWEAAVNNTKLNVVVSLDKNARHLKYAVTCDWRDFGVPGKVVPQLAFRVPLAYACDTFAFDNAFGLVQRKGTGSDLPGLSFAFAPRGGGKDGLMLSSNTKYGFRCDNNTMALSLIRSSYDPDPVPEIYTHTFCMNIGIVENASPAKLVEATLRQNRAAIAVACGSQAGELPLTGSFIKLVEGDAIISSVKITEDGGSMIIRLYDVSGKDGVATLEFFKPVVSAVFADVHECVLEGNRPEVKKNVISFNLHAYGTITAKIIME